MKFSSTSFHNLQVISVCCAGTCYRPARYASCSWAGQASTSTWRCEEKNLLREFSKQALISLTLLLLLLVPCLARRIGTASGRGRANWQHRTLCLFSFSSTPAVAPLHANACCFTLFRRSRQRSRYPRSTHVVHASAPSSRMFAASGHRQPLPQGSREAGRGPSPGLSSP